jgi:2-polyprenyl-3-methyl-5-hydroxy-6-metoxy-1,4-benzoquinol methylase
MYNFANQIPFLKYFYQHHFDYNFLANYLKNKHQLEKLDQIAVKSHLNKCKKCWEVWNKVRWNHATGSKGLNELKEYMGDKFVQYYDSSYALAREWYQISPITEHQIKEFYKTTNNYIYNLVIWYESKDREDFATELINLAEDLKLKSFVDFGCGVGNDGLFLIANGYKTYFIDFDCPSIKFLKWRAKKRNLEVEVYNIESLKVLPDADAVFAIDVLEHMVDPLDVIMKLSSSTKLFAHRSEFNQTHGGRHPFHLKFNEGILNNALVAQGFHPIKSKCLSCWYR